MNKCALRECSERVIYQRLLFSPPSSAGKEPWSHTMFWTCATHAVLCDFCASIDEKPRVLYAQDGKIVCGRHRVVRLPVGRSAEV